MARGNLKIFFAFALIVLFINFSSAFGFDNVKKDVEIQKGQSIQIGEKEVAYNSIWEKYKPIEIKDHYDLFGVTLFKGAITKHTDKCVDNCESIIEIEHNGGVLIEEIRFVGTPKSYEIVIDVGDEEFNVDDYETTCSQKTSANGTEFNDCKRVKTGTHKESRDIWTSYLVGSELSKGDYKIKVAGVKAWNEEVDWQIKVAGSWINEWALWSGADGPIAYYKLDETSGTTAVDSTGNMNGTNDGAVIGGIGKINTAYEFDGSNDYVNLTNLNIDTNTLSISSWFKRGTPDGDMIFSKWDGGGDNRFGVGFLSTSTNLSVIVGTDDTWRTISSSVDTNFHHVVLVISPTNFSVYFDGLNAIEEQATSYEDVETDLWLGAFNTDSGYFNGTIDEVGIWNRTLSETEIEELYNEGIGLGFGGEVGDMIYSFEDNFQGWTNTTEDISRSTTWSSLGNYSVKFDGIAGGLYLDNVNMSAYNWIYVDANAFPDRSFLQMYVCDAGGAFNCEAILSFTDTGESVFNEANVTSITGLKFILFEHEIVLPDTGDPITYIDAVRFQENRSNYVEEISQDYEATALSGSTQTFSIELLYDSDYYDNYLGYLYYNGTPYLSTATNDGNYVTFTLTATTPVVSTSTTIPFYWDIEFLGDADYGYTSDEINQTVAPVVIDNCSVFTTPLINYSLVDEVSQSLIVSGGQTIELDLELKSLNGLNVISQLNKSYSGNSAAVCLNGSIGEAEYSLFSQVKYYADGYAKELYNIQNFTINADTLNQNITLYDLNSSDSTEFLVKYQDNTLTTVEGAVVQLLRKYISEGVYKVVEAPLTSNTGTAVLHIDLSSNLYKAIIVKDGVILDTFDNIVFKCESELSGICTQNLFGSIDPQNSVSSDILNDFSYVISEEGDTITVTYSIPSGVSAVVNITLEQVDLYGNTTMCNRSITSSAGSLSCSYNETIGDSIVYLTIYKAGVLQAQKSYLIPEEGTLSFLGNNFFIVLILLLSLVGMAMSSPEWIILNGIAVMVLAGGIWLLNGINFAVGLGTLVWLLISAVILIYKIAQQEDR